MPKAKKQDRITHLSRVVFEGYKSIDHLEIDLVKGLNILIGKNGSGKSNFLNLLYSVFYFPMLSEQPPMSIYYKSARIVLDTKDGTEIDWYTEKSNKNGAERIYEYTNVPSGDSFSREIVSVNKDEVFNTTRQKDEFLDTDGGGKINVRYIRGLYYVIDRRKIIFQNLVFIRYNIPNVLIGMSTPGNISIDKKTMSLTYLRNNIETIGSFFSDFVSKYMPKYSPLGIKLEGIKLDRSQILSELEFPVRVKLNLKRLSPIQDVRVSPNINIYEDENRASIDNIILEFNIDGNWIPWSYLSDGTKRLFYLISQISYFDKHAVLIEEPELGIHPHQFHTIMNFLKEESENRQIIMSTHSPEALNVLNDDELQNIIVTKYNKKKGTTMSHLNKQQIAKAKAYMKDEYLFLSDYWVMSDLEK